MSEIFFRLDYLDHLTPYKDRWSCTLYVIHPKAVKIHIDIEAGSAKSTLFERGEDGWVEADAGLEAASADCVEIAVPFDLTGASVR